jgi:hypothetical protein
MLRPLFILLACTTLSALACSSAPGGGDNTGGTSSGGTSTGSGGVPASGGTANGASDTGGTSAGGNRTGAGGSGGSVGNLGGEAATGGSEASGGAGVEGTGGTASERWGPCDEALGNEGNPACDDDELCVGTVCAETCPTDLGDAATYECPGTSSGDALSQCAWLLGHCHLICDLNGYEQYTCPSGMVCDDLGACAWPE